MTAATGTDVRQMFDRVAERYDAANLVISAGVDVLWRRKAIGALLEGLGEAPRLLDLGAGTLDGALEIVRRAPGAPSSASANGLRQAALRRRTLRYRRSAAQA